MPPLKSFLADIGVLENAGGGDAKIATLSDEQRKQFNDTLLRKQSFHNPHQLDADVLKYNVWEPGSMVTDMFYEEEEFYDQIRKEQDIEWAQERVKRGVRYAKSRQFAEAIKAYDQALSLDNKHVDAYVARGAARVSASGPAVVGLYDSL
jgi:tetratricopeptide (TPR) repeat protein